MMESRAASILVVDESRRKASALADRLRAGGFLAVHTVADPRETPMRVRELRPDVVAVDHGGALDALTVVDGLQALRLDPLPALLVVCAGPPGEALRQGLLQRGVRDLVGPDAIATELLPRLSAMAAVQLRLRELVRRTRELEAALAERSDKLHDAVTILRKAEQRLHEQLANSRAESKGKSELLAMAAHELRTPLHAIIGFADLLRQQAHGSLGDARYLDYAGDIHTAASQLLHLVDDTLDLAKAESGQVPLDLRRVDIGRVVEESARLLRSLAEQTGIVLSVRTPDTPLMIRTDPDKVRQVVVNLATNAIKFTPRGGQVMVDVRSDQEGGALILVIRDTGTGMTRDEVTQALLPFRQPRQPVQQIGRSTGLGLPLTRRFVEMLGGSMDIDSQPGQGTTVTVRLPPDAAPSQPQAAE